VVLVCVPGVLLGVHSTLATLGRLAEQRLPPDKEKPPMPVMLALAAVQSVVLVGVATAIGTVTAPRVGLEAPFFQALADGGPLWPAIRPQLLPSVVVGVIGALVFIVAYYRFFRPRLDDETVQRMEELRNSIGIWGRVLYGGVVEEVLTRWALMSLLAWLGALLVGNHGPAVIWMAIVVSGILFGLGHAPSYLAAGCHKTPMFFTTMISLNLWASLIFGWMFWQYGLLAAMLAHALFHLVWLPFDHRYYQPVQQALGV
jgi:hypothetical protein